MRAARIPRLGFILLTETALIRAVVLRSSFYLVVVVVTVIVRFSDDICYYYAEHEQLPIRRRLSLHARLLRRSCSYLLHRGSVVVGAEQRDHLSLVVLRRCRFLYDENQCVLLRAG